MSGAAVRIVTDRVVPPWDFPGEAAAPTRPRAIPRTPAASPNGRASVSAATQPSRVVVPAESILRFRTAAELAQDAPPEPKWIVTGFAAPGALTEIVAKVKLGKTTFVGQMVGATLDGKPF